jgi:hypothetical protein
VKLFIAFSCFFADIGLQISESDYITLKKMYGQWRDGLRPKMYPDAALQSVFGNVQT